jgi:hypothetical protein
MVDLRVITEVVKSIIVEERSKNSHVSIEDIHSHACKIIENKLGIINPQFIFAIIALELDGGNINIE